MEVAKKTQQNKPCLKKKDIVNKKSLFYYISSFNLFPYNFLVMFFYFVAVTTSPTTPPEIPVAVADQPEDKVTT